MVFNKQFTPLHQRTFVKRKLFFKVSSSALQWTICLWPGIQSIQKTWKIRCCLRFIPILYLYSYSILCWTDLCCCHSVLDLLSSETILTNSAKNTLFSSLPPNPSCKKSSLVKSFVGICALSALSDIFSKQCKVVYLLNFNHLTDLFNLISEVSAAITFAFEIVTIVGENNYSEDSISSKIVGHFKINKNCCFLLVGRSWLFTRCNIPTKLPNKEWS